jgi:putative transcriptional regulator
VAIKTQKRPRPAANKHEPDWAAIDALTDEQIDAQIAADPDVAPDVSDWPINGATLIISTDVKAIRAKFGLSQDRFAKTFALNLATLRDWEQERRMPHGPARTLLQIIDREPEAVRRALGPQPKPLRNIRKRIASEPKTVARQPAAGSRRRPARRPVGKEA